MGRKNQWEVLFWSIALPGFGQILNKKYAKGILFILLEFTINLQANLNEAIIFLSIFFLFVGALLGLMLRVLLLRLIR